QRAEGPGIDSDIPRAEAGVGAVEDQAARSDRGAAGVRIARRQHQRTIAAFDEPARTADFGSQPSRLAGGRLDAARVTGQRDFTVEVHLCAVSAESEPQRAVGAGAGRLARAIEG